MSSPGTRGTYTCCRMLDSGAVTTCFNDLDLRIPGGVTSEVQTPTKSQAHSRPNLIHKG